MNSSTMVKREFIRIIQHTRAHEKKPVANMMLKLMEETGELAEAVNHAEGYLPHKTMKEEPMGEIADVVQNAIAIAAKLYPELSAEELMVRLVIVLSEKNSKWEQITRAERERERIREHKITQIAVYFR